MMPPRAKIIANITTLKCRCSTGIMIFAKSVCEAFDKSVERLEALFMKKIFIFILFILPFAVLAKSVNNTPEKIIAYFDERENLHSGEPNTAYYYRMILQSDSDGGPLIQDFYVLSDKAKSTDKLKFTDPYKVKNVTLEDFYILPYEGSKTLWATNGVKFNETNYLNGKPHGPSFAWYPVNGEKWIELNYVNGKRNGSYTSWHLNGKVEKKGYFVNDQPDGLWLSWSEDGEQTKSELFKNGKVVEQ